MKDYFKELLINVGVLLATNLVGGWLLSAIFAPSGQGYDKYYSAIGTAIIILIACAIFTIAYLIFITARNSRKGNNSKVLANLTVIGTIFLLVVFTIAESN